jgi:DtxR family Mn-dependent transcriptional regulator
VEDKMKLSHSLEDYLEAIWIISLEKKVVRVKDIMQFLGYKVSSVNNALKNLASKNLISHERYGYIDLTPQGVEIAKTIYHKHQTISKFFSQILQVSPDKSEKDACNVEHYLSEETFNRFYHFINFLESFDNNCLKEWKNYIEKIKKEEKVMNLTKLKLGKKAKILKINAQGKLKQKLLSMGVISGETILIEKISPLGDPIDCIVKNYHLSLRKDEAENIIVEEI